MTDAPEITARLASVDDPARARRRLIDGPEPVTWGQLAGRAARLRTLLDSAGVGRGDRLAVATDDEAELAAAFVACLRSGIVLVPLAGEAAPSEARALMASTDPAAILVDDAIATAWRLSEEGEGRVGVPLWQIAAAAPAKPTLFGRLLGRKKEAAEAAPTGPLRYPALLDAHTPWSGPDLDIGGDDVALVLATSGSTGGPKRVPLTVGNLIAQAETMPRLFGIDADSRVMNLSPMIHVDGITGLFVALWTGSTLVRTGPFTIPRLQETLDALYRHRVTHALLVPTMLSLALRLGQDLRDAFGGDELRLVISTAAPLPATLQSEFEQATGTKIVNMYGMTEVGNVLFSGPDEAARRVGSVGVPVDCEVRVVDSEGGPVGDGETGELLVRGPSVMPGYLGPVSGLVDHDGQPWFATGDLVRVDEGGFFHVVGRRKRLIIVGGRNVHPEEVSDVLVSHPAVVEAVTVGLPDESFGERVVSCVVTREEAATASLLEWSAKRLSPYKVPRDLYVWDSLPRTPSGKVKPDAVVERLAAMGHRATEQGGARDVEAEVITLAAAAFRAAPSELTLSTSSADFRGWDSFAHLSLILALEETFGITLSPREITAADTLGAATRLVRSKLGG